MSANPISKTWLKWSLAALLGAGAALAAAHSEPLAPDEASVDVDADAEAEATQAFARMDSDRDGQLSLEEFERGVARPFGYDGGGVVWQRLPARFRALDGDGSSYLEAAEFEQLVQGWHGPGAAPGFAAADRNRDARVDFREFVLLLLPREEPAAPEAEPTR